MQVDDGPITDIEFNKVNTGASYDAYLKYYKNIEPWCLALDEDYVLAIEADVGAVFY